MRTNVVNTFSLETWGYKNIFVGGKVGSLLEELDIFQKTMRLDKKRLDFIMAIANDFEIILLINFKSQSCQHVL